MEKVLHIEGMSCMHCAGRVEAALSDVQGVVMAKVDLEGKKATVQTNGDVGDEALAKAVTDAGYTVVDVK